MKTSEARKQRCAILLAVCSLMSLLLAGVCWAQEQPEQFQQPPWPAGDGVCKFDFGAPESGVGEGYYRVLPETAYSAEQGFGYTEGRAYSQAFDQNRRIIRDVLQLDDITRDGIYGGTPFRIDLPDGKYRVVVLTGQYSRPGANRPDSHFRDYTITAGGVTLCEQVNSPEAFFDPEGRYFHNYYRDWHPDVNLYEENISRWIPFAEAEVEVAGGSLEVEASRYAPINALWIFPVDSKAGQTALDELRADQRAFFNDQYPCIPDEPEHPMPDLPADVARAGAVMYVRENAGSLRPGTRPVARDLGRPLRLFARPGEREPGVVAVTPLRDIEGDIDLIASDLQGANGATIPVSALDIRYIRYGEYPVMGGYEVRPHFLVPWRPDRMEEGITRGFWVDLHTPEDAQPGFYDGTLTLTGPGAGATLPVEVRVLPLKLPRCRLYAGVYAGDLRGTTFRHYRGGEDVPDELVRKVLRKRMEFLAEQGFTGLYDSLGWYPFEYNDGQIETTDTWEYWLEVFRTAASIPNFSERIFCYYVGGPQMFPKCPQFLSRRAIPKMDIDEIVFSDEAVQEMTAMVKFFYEQMRAEGRALAEGSGSRREPQGLPELVFYVQDELGNDGAKGARYGRELLKALNRCREAVPGGFRTCISTLRASIAREYLDEADIVMPNAAFPVNEETIAELRDHGCTLGLYNMGATRFSYGFYPWRVDAYNRAQWSFSYDGDSRDPYVALPSGARGSCDCRYTPDWEVLPSIGMLVQREGVDDYRYIQLLEETVQAAEQAGKGNAAEVKGAKAVLTELRDAVKVNYLDPDNNWDNSTMNYWRWRVAEAAMKVEAVL